MDNFLFFPASSITQISKESFKLVNIYGGVFNLQFPHLAVYLSQPEEIDNPESLEHLGISPKDYQFILRDLLDHKVVYPSKIRMDLPFDKNQVLSQILNCPFTQPRTLNIGDVTLELTQNCPYSCEGCFREINEDQLTNSARLERLVDELSLMGLSKISLSGGEITSSERAFDRFKQLAKYIRQHPQIKIRLLTTGFNPERVTEALDYIDEIQISVDGLEDAHDSYKRVSGAFRKAIGSIDFCQKSKVTLTTNTVVSQKNRGEVSSLIDYLSQFKIDTLRITKILSDKEHLRLGVKEAQDLYCVVQIKQTEHPNLRIINAYGNCTDVLNCVGGMVYAHIGATGNVFPCDYDIHNSGGNINNSPFQDIWTNSEVFHAYRNVIGIQSECLDCKSRVFCFGNCRIDRQYVRTTGMCELK